MTVKKDGVKVSEEKFTKEEKVPGYTSSRTGIRALKDANDNNLEGKVSGRKNVSKMPDSKGESKGAEAVIDLKAEAAKRRQSKLSLCPPPSLSISLSFLSSL